MERSKSRSGYLTTLQEESSSMKSLILPDVNRSLGSHQGGVAAHRSDTRESTVEDACPQ